MPTETWAGAHALTGKSFHVIYSLIQPACHNNTNDDDSRSPPSETSSENRSISWTSEIVTLSNAQGKNSENVEIKPAIDTHWLCCFFSLFFADSAN